MNTPVAGNQLLARSLYCYIREESESVRSKQQCALLTHLPT